MKRFSKNCGSKPCGPCAKRVSANGLLMTVGAGNPPKKVTQFRDKHQGVIAGSFKVSKRGGKVVVKTSKGSMPKSKGSNPKKGKKARVTTVVKSTSTRTVTTNPKKGGFLRQYTLHKNVAERMAKVEGNELAKKGAQKFHGAAPRRVKVFEYDDGKPGVREKALFAIGEAHVEIDTVKDPKGRDVKIKPLALGTVYRVPANSRSNKSGRQWIHSHKESGGKPPLNCYDPVERTIRPLGGTTYVSDWIRK